MSGAHRIEVSPNNRAGCKNTECKREGIKIPKGQLRYGTFITGPEWQSWAWKHWGCVTPKQISNLRDSIGGDPSQLDGYEELPEDLQEKVVNALEQGHIDDEDWGWDIEMNREGKNGYLTLESKRRLKAEAQALKDETAGEGSASPSKTDNKKRGHVKDDPDAEGAAIDEPPPKKTKARTKEEPKIENDDANGEPENEDPKIKKSKPRVKKEPKIKNEEADGGSENEDPKLKKPKSRVKKEQKIKNEDTKNEGPANKKTKATVKKGKMANSNDADEDFEQEAQPVKKGRKQARKATAGGETALDVKEESGDPNALPPPKGKRQRAPRKAATAKKIKDEDTETDGLISAPELETPPGNEKPEHPSELEPEASEQVPKLQKGRKGAPRKVIDGPAEKAEKKVVSKAGPAGPRSNGRPTRAYPA